MSTFVLIHGAGDGGWSWHLVEVTLRERGHDVVAPDLPADDDAKTLDDYADAVVAAVGERRDLVVVAHSFGGFTAPLVCARLPVDALIYVSAMLPAPGEAPDDWWRNTGYKQAVAEQAARDGVTGSDDPHVCFYHDVPRELADEAILRQRAHPTAAANAAPWPLDVLPDVPTRFVLCTEDRFFPAAFMRRLVAERLAVVPDEIAAGHCVALGHPGALADLLIQLGHRAQPRLRLLDHYDDELRRHNDRLRAATDVRPGDHVLDIGCGAGQTTRDAARGATRALGVDISDELVARARRRTADEGLGNATYAVGDAQTYPFAPASFDLLISRFGTMFFADPPAAFANLARAARPDARLVMIVWQTRAQNEWATAIRDALGADPLQASKLDPFSLADPATVSPLLTSAGFTDITFADVREPVYYGPDPTSALDLVRDMKGIRDHLAQLDAATAQRTVARLHAMLAAHHTPDGVRFDSLAWLITARRA